MAPENQQLDSQMRWKSRYYEVLAELEGKEKGWREAERLLRQLVTRLTLAADTRHKNLTQNLTALRSGIRDGGDVMMLQALVADISEQIAELDKLRKHDDQAGHPGVIFVDILEKLDLPDELNREFRQLKKNIKKLGKHDDASEVSAEFMNIIQRLLHDEEEPTEPTRKQKLISKLLSRDKKPEVKAQEAGGEAETKPGDASKEVPPRFIAPAVGELLLQLALRLPDEVKRKINFGALKKHTNKARRRKDLIPIVDVIAQQIESAYQPEVTETVEMQVDSVIAVAEAIKQFFLQLDPPADLKQRVAELEQFYSERTGDVDGLVHCLNALAEVVAEICNRLAFQRDELESFFSQLANRLQDLDSGIKKTSSLYNESQESNAKMGKAVSDEVTGIKTSIENTSDLSNLKEEIQTRLDAIDNHVQGFRDAEKNRFNEAQNVIAELTEKVSLLEENSVQLRNKLEETQQKALRDVLTGIPNRQAYEERLAEEIARSKRYGAALTMVVWDIDNFKNINDTFGHAAGDRVLKVIASLLSERVRETDFVARYGGEEFVTLMPETELDVAMKVADKLRMDIEQTPFHFRDTRVPMTISAGLAQYQAEEIANNLFERADAALYKAKQAGRNQINAAD